MDKTNYQKWVTQLRKGYLELCVLVYLQQRMCAYGLEILQALASTGLEVNEGTLYPLLNRMQQNGWLESEWQTPETSGHPRRFYRLQGDCKLLVPQMIATFDTNHEILEQLKNC
jgi:PadR family transcriptional regulator, regulatory protein PadR